MPELHPSLLQGIERGERSALEALARAYAGPVYRYLVRLCGNATLAEDLAQEVAVQLWRALPGRRFPNERALNAWIYTVATNAFRMHCRRRRAGEVAWETGLELPAGEECDPARTAERDDLARRVRRAVELLPAPERQAVLLKAFSDLRYREIAEVTGEPVGTVKWRIARAYARLRELLLGETEYELECETVREEDDHEPVRATAAVPGRGSHGAGAVANAAPPAALSRLFGTRGR